jgi:hypothetical membrane protein
MTLETGMRLWRWANALTCLGVVQFLCLCTLAMLWYPGGTLLQENTVGYSFSENFLSDLGRTVSWSGQPNGTAATLFNTAVVVLAVSLIPFFLFLPAHAPDRSTVLWVAAVFGVGSALALMAIGLTPYDTHFVAHHRALCFWVIFLLATVILHFWALYTSEECASFLAVFSLGFAFLIGSYMLRGLDLFLASLFRSASVAVPGSVKMQKWVVLGAVCWYLVFGLRMVCSKQLRPG